MEPVTEVGERDDALARHVAHVLKDLLGALGGLQGHGQHHHVELVAAAEHAQAILDVALDHVHAASGTGQHLGIVDLDTVAVAMLDLREVGQQGAVAAAQVKHVGIGADPVGDDGQVGPQFRGFSRHQAFTPEWMRSK